MLRRVNHQASLLIRLGAVLVLALLASLLSARSTRACSCLRPSFEEARAGAAAIFEGRVEEIAPVDGELRVRLHVTQAWRGVAHEGVEVRTASQSAACGFTFERGQHYLVYASAREDALVVSLCSRTAPMDDAGEDRQLLGSGTIPVDIEDDADEPAREPPATRAGCASCGVSSARGPRSLGTLLVAGLLALVGWRSRR
ncbi:MAG: hypothetical protein ACK5U8_23210 [Deltaproteobacteria bacterium]